MPELRDITKSTAIDNDLDPVDGEAVFTGLATKLNLSGGTMTGALVLPNGTAGSPSLGVGGADTGFFRSGSSIYATVQGAASAQYTQTGMAFYTQAVANTFPSFTFERLDSTIVGQLGLSEIKTIARNNRSPTSRMQWSSFITLSLGTTANAEETQLRFNGVKAGADTAFFYVSSGAFDIRTGALQIASTTVIDAERLIQTRVYTTTTLPTASANTNKVCSVSNGASNKRLVISDGTAWRYMDGATV